MFKKFYPDIRFNSIKDITPDLFKEKGIGYALLDVQGVVDYEGLSLSSGDHVTIGEEEVLVVGEVTLT